MPSPEPNYAQRAQNCEQERDTLRMQVAMLSNVDVDLGELKSRLLAQVNEQEQVIRQQDIQMAAMRTDNQRLRDEIDVLRRRANDAENKLTESRVAMLKCDTFMNDLRNVVRGRL